MKKDDTIMVFDERRSGDPISYGKIAEGEIISVKSAGGVIHIFLHTGYRVTIVSDSLEYEVKK